MLKLKYGFIEKTGRFGTPMVGDPKTGLRVAFDEDDGRVRVSGRRDKHGDCYFGSDSANAENWREVAHKHLITHRQESPWEES